MFSCRNTDKKIARTGVVHNVKNDSAQNYLNRAEQYDSLKLYDKAFYNYNKAKEFYILREDSIMTGYSLTKMAGLQYILSDYFGSEDTAVEALKFFNDKNRYNYLTADYNILGMSYRKSLNYNESIHYYKNAIKISADSLPQSIIKNNIASVYADAGNYNQALSILLKLNKSDTVNNYPSTKARVLNNLGDIYFKLKKPIALTYLKEALKIREALNDPKDLTSSYLNLSEFYKFRDKSLSKNYALKAEKMAAKVNNADDRLEALQILSSVTDGAEYKYYTSKYIKLQDSVTIVKLKAKSQFAAIKYNSKTAEAENLKLKAQQTQDKLQAQKDNLYKVILGLAIAIIVITGGFVFYFMRIKHKREKDAEAYKTETRISKKIHDELANDVFKVMSFAESQDFSSPVQQQKLVQNLDSIYTKTRDISRENNTIDTGENYGLVLTEMLADYKTESTNVMVVNFETVNWDKIAAHKKITVYRTLQELMVNMKKHSGASIAAIKFDKDDKNITIQYTDNGKGFSDEKLIYKNGLQNAETRIFSVGGNITFESEPNKGLKAIIKVPV